MKQGNGKIVATSFQDLRIIITDSGEAKLVTSGELAEITKAKDSLSYLDADKQMLDAFQEMGDEGAWLEGDEHTNIGLIRRTVFLESSFISNDAKVFLDEQGYPTNWMANQGIMMSGAHCFGMPKTMMIYLAKSLDLSGKTFKFNYPIGTDLKPIDQYKKNEIDGIWVWDEEAAGNDDDAWIAHPALLQRTSYQDLTDAEEGAVMAYVQENYLKDTGFRVVSGFTMIYGKHRYCMVMPDFRVEAASGRIVTKKTGRVSKAATIDSRVAPEVTNASMWDQREKVSIRYPRLLQTKHGDSKKAAQQKSA